jgi:hypothetical protein
MLASGRTVRLPRGATAALARAGVYRAISGTASVCASSYPISTRPVTLNSCRSSRPASTSGSASSGSTNTPPPYCWTRTPPVALAGRSMSTSCCPSASVVTVTTSPVTSVTRWVAAAEPSGGGDGSAAAGEGPAMASPTATSAAAVMIESSFQREGVGMQNVYAAVPAE